MSERTWKQIAKEYVRHSNAYLARARSAETERAAARAEIRRLKREGAAMRKALAPFAEYARRSDEVHGIRDTIEVCFGVTMADMRAARAVLSPRPRTTNRTTKGARK